MKRAIVISFVVVLGWIGCDTSTGPEETISTPLKPGGPEWLLWEDPTATYATGGAVSSLGHPVIYQFNWGNSFSSGWGPPERWTGESVVDMQRFMVDTLRGMDFQARHLLLALRAGDRVPIARALASEGMFVATGGHGSRNRSARLVNLAAEIAEEADDARSVGFAQGGLAMRAYQLGDFREGLDYSEQALHLFHNKCIGATWETDAADLVRIWSLHYLGKISELSAQVPGLIRIAQERGDRFAETSLSLGLPAFRWLAADDVEGGRRNWDGVMKEWSHLGFHLQHYWEWVIRRQAEIYEGESTIAHRAVAETWSMLRHSLFLRIHAVRVESLDIRGRAALAVAASKPPLSKDELHVARQAVQLVLRRL